MSDGEMIVATPTIYFYINTSLKCAAKLEVDKINPWLLANYSRYGALNS